MAKQLGGGYSSLETVTPREILHNTQPGSYMLLPGGIVIDGTNGRDGGFTRTYDIRAGWWMGQITASGMWTPCKRTTTTTSATGTSVVLVNSYAFAAGDVISIGTDTGITISAINYSTHTITIASTTTLTGEAVVAEDGSQQARGILFDFARLRDLPNTAAANVPSSLLIGGEVDSAYLLGDTAAILAAAKAGIADVTLERQFIDGIQVYTNNKRVY